MAGPALTFGVDDRPPAQITIFYALQVVMSVVSSPVSAAYIIHANLCAPDDTVLLAKIISTTLVMCGVATFLQVTVGVRLPITQGSSFMYFSSIIALMQTDDLRCDAQVLNDTSLHNLTAPMLQESYRNEWQPRVLLLSGAMTMVSILHMALGFFGVIGWLTRFVGPLTVTPTVALISIMMYGTIAQLAKPNWGITFFTAGLAMLFAIVLGDCQLPILSWNRSKGCHRVRYPMLRIFANILAIFGGWILCAILTAAGAFPSSPSALGYRARTDAKLTAITQMDWFYFPYPCQWGIPTLSVTAVIALIPAVIGSTVESIGDYYATARIVGKLPVPRHAMNRGIFVEGVASVFSGLIGACHATTSYSQVAGFIAYTGMACRIMWQVGALLFVLCGIFGKMGAVLAILPDPVVGGMMLVGLAMIFSVAIGNLEHVNMKISRNQMVLGMAVILGVSVPLYVKQDLGIFNTGTPELDQVLSVLLTNGPIVGGIVGCVLDNLLPGSREDRGMAMQQDNTESESESHVTTYDLPFSKYVPDVKLFQYIPILPSYKGGDCGCSCRKRCKDNSYDLKGKPAQPCSDRNGTTASINVIHVDDSNV